MPCSGFPKEHPGLVFCSLKFNFVITELFQDSVYFAAESRVTSVLVSVVIGCLTFSKVSTLSRVLSLSIGYLSQCSFLVTIQIS